MGVKLVALDIDGTIIPPNTPPEEAYPSRRLLAAVQLLRENGIVVVVASGRMFPGTAEVARHFAIDTPLICLQGCSVHLADGSLLHQFPMDEPLARDIVAFSREAGWPFEWFTPFRYIVSSPNEDSERYAHVSGVKPEYIAAPEESGIIPIGVGIISTATEAPVIHRQLAAQHGEAVHLLDFPTVTVAVAPNANKGHALSLLCDDLGIQRHEVVAVGDSVNDAGMLAWAGRGIAMAHSDRYALDAADEVLPDDGADTLAALLEGLAGPVRSPAAPSPRRSATGRSGRPR